MPAAQEAFGREHALEHGLTMHLRCMETLNGYCSANAIAHHAACARERLRASGASTLFVATMHARDRKTLTRALNGSAEVHIEASHVERIQNQQTPGPCPHEPCGAL